MTTVILQNYLTRTQTRTVESYFGVLHMEEQCREVRVAAF